MHESNFQNFSGVFLSKYSCIRGQKICCLNRKLFSFMKFRLDFSEREHLCIRG